MAVRKSSDEPQGKIEFVQVPGKSPEDLVRGILGISLVEFIYDVKKNENGKYDFLYEFDRGRFHENTRYIP